MLELRAVRARDKCLTTDVAKENAAFYRSEGMPMELRTAELLMSEEKIFSQKPIPLVMIPDQVYLIRNEDLVIVDTKCRKNRIVTDKERLQFSLYRMGLQNTRHPKLRGLNVRPYGYVRFVVNGRVSYTKVDTFTDEQLVHIWLSTYCDREQ